jgi:hypothetical protein
VEAYVDDVVIKTENPEIFIKDLQLYNGLRRYRWKLNLEKCVFGEPAGKLLGFIVSHRGTTTVTEKGTKTYGVHGNAMPFYFKTRRKEDGIL